MEIRKWLVLGVWCFQACAVAQTAEVKPAMSLDEARVQRAKGKALGAEAEARYAAEKAICQNKAIAIGCMSSAKDRHTEAVKAATALEREGRAVERELHRQEVEAKAAKRAAEAPAAEARQQADIERYRDKEAQRAAERERSRAEEAAKLETRRSKAAADRAAQQSRIEARRAEDAKRAAKAPENVRKRAEREKQHAEQVKKIDERARNYAELLRRREEERKIKEIEQATAASWK